MKSSVQNKKKTFRNLVIFTIITLTIGWIGRGLDMLMSIQTREGLGILL